MALFVLCQGYQGFGAVERGGGDCKVAAMQARNLTAQAQTDAAAAGLRGEEAPEQIRHHLCRDTTAVVLNADVGVTLADGYIDMDAR